MQLSNLSIGTKIASAIVIFLFPIGLLGYFLYCEKLDLINFAKQEVAGVHYLRAAHEALAAVTNPTPEALTKAADALNAAEAADAGTLNATEKSNALAEMLKSAATGKEEGELLGKTTDLIATLSDNSNITLDPDGDAYFVGDMLVNQSTGLIVQTYNLTNAAKKLDAAHNEDNVIAYAEARDGAATSAGNIATELGKAIKNNADGAIKAALETDGAALAEAVAKMVETTKTTDRAALTAATTEVSEKARAFALKNADEMERLLNVRNAGFYNVIITRLGIALAAVIAGMAIFWVIIRSITKPLAQITKLMERLAWGELDIEVPTTKRTDEIGKLTTSLRAFYDGAVENAANQKKERERTEIEKKRAELIQQTTAQFESKVQSVVNTLAVSASNLAKTAEALVKTMNDTSQSVQNMATSANQTTGNVQSVASAAEEMTAAVREISGQLQNSNSMIQDSVNKAEAADSEAGSLNVATNKVKEVIELISNISGQINLLALNATIESARAGEAGKGFAVVASEVKNLANQTNKSVQDIGNVIGEMEKASDKIIDSLKDIKGSVQNISGASSTIAAAVEEQSATTNEIARNMQFAAEGTQVISTGLGGISRSTSEAGTSSDMVLAASQEFSKQAENLSREVGEFLQTIRAA